MLAAIVVAAGALYLSVAIRAIVNILTRRGVCPAAAWRHAYIRMDAMRMRRSSGGTSDRRDIGPDPIAAAIAALFSRLRQLGSAPSQPHSSWVAVCGCTTRACTGTYICAADTGNTGPTLAGSFFAYTFSFSAAAAWRLGESSILAFRMHRKAKPADGDVGVTACARPRGVAASRLPFAARLRFSSNLRTSTHRIRVANALLQPLSTYDRIPARIGRSGHGRPSVIAGVAARQQVILFLLFVLQRLSVTATTPVAVCCCHIVLHDCEINKASLWLRHVITNPCGI